MKEASFTPDGNYGKSRRIASNTMLLFMRMFAITIINLYTVRLILGVLGQTDYGIYQAVGGVIATAGCVSTTLALSVQRFYSYSMGRDNFVKLQEVFSASTNIIFILVCVIIFFFETVGTWFLNTQMVLPAERLTATNWVFQFALFSFLLSVLQIPYTAAIFAHEEMGVYALLSTIDCLLRLAVACLIGKIFLDNLVFYALGLLTVSILIFCSYATFARHRYAECHYRKTTEPKLYKQLLSFSGWTLYSSLAGVGVIQGSTILLNVFFGPIINAAFGIAVQVNNAFNALCSSMMLAFRPAMIKSYAAKETDYLNTLFISANKFIFYVLIAVAIPLVTEMDTILQLWLGQSSETTTLFVRLIIIYVVCIAMCNPINTIMQASGRIKRYHLTVETVMLLHIPASWLLLTMGLPPQCVLYSIIALCLLAHCFRLYCLRQLSAHFSMRQYFLSLVCPALVVTSISAASSLAVHLHIASPAWRLATLCAWSPVIIFVLAYWIGLSRQERLMLRSLASTTIKKKRT